MDFRCGSPSNDPREKGSSVKLDRGAAQTIFSPFTLPSASMAAMWCSHVRKSKEFAKEG
jgi:hypothetical protein